MKISLCTISFRHSLVSFATIVRFALRERFDGIELWGAHAEWLATAEERESTKEQLRLMHGRGMRIAMISDYFDIGSEERFAATQEKAHRMAALARWYGTTRLRTFAGPLPSRQVSPELRRDYVKRLRALSGICAQYGVTLLAETHPGTLSDELASARLLIDEVGHSAFGINLDFLHLWEAGDDVLQAYAELKPWVHHFHLKNVTSADRLHVFEPAQVYASGSDRTGMVPLPDGALDFRPIIAAIGESELFSSLEWFGAQPFETLAADAAWLRQLTDGSGQVGVGGALVQAGITE
ncbi:sugar phosphate isomerase/epimerase family protein [Paenibacillus sp. MMS18-CY102]|uniref:sugar phosphate isomerase/epimerase family protein n=1 Tax=Paenibacillus sp. MMS18-CY102 TaxID=2682849 RepID=UPI00136558CC|nr:sugar phosphate isomerase/epimerase family protein [Paenibacillus sp. MMS18-CY102]MWC29947.1 TIM barrel protein [Paenibacillus sp. MMS18-CY102]